MERYGWLAFFVLGLLVLWQLANVAQRLSGIAAMMRRLLSKEGVEWETAAEPSARVQELALGSGTYVAAIKAYREQTGLGLKEAKAAVDRLTREHRDTA